MSGPRDGGEGVDEGVADLRVSVRLTGPQHLGSVRERAAAAVRSGLERARGPVRDARVRLGRHPDPAAEPPVFAEAGAVVRGRPVRARVHGHTDLEVLDLLRDKLRAQVAEDRRRHDAGWEDRRGAPGDQRPPWRRPVLDRPSPTFRAGGPDTRGTTRVKRLHVRPTGLDEAVQRAELLDHDAYLFVEAGSGRDAALHARRDGWVLQFTAPVPRREQLARYVTPVHLLPEAAPVLTLEAAADRLARTPAPFLFFTLADDATSRHPGRLLYRRFAGGLGVLRLA